MRVYGWNANFNAYNSWREIISPLMSYLGTEAQSKLVALTAALILEAVYSILKRFRPLRVIRC